MSKRVTIENSGDASFLMEALERHVGLKQAEITQRFIDINTPLDEATRQKLSSDYVHYEALLQKYKPRLLKWSSNSKRVDDLLKMIHEDG
jgi:hypothetical protein